MLISYVTSAGCDHVLICFGKHNLEIIFCRVMK